jgi:RimJ/RimL family protein N-acetyltransferase
MLTETLRLQIRDYTQGDCGAFALLMADPEVMRFSVKGPLGPEEAQEHFQKRILDHYKTYGFGLWALVGKEQQEMIGFAGLIAQEIDGEKKIELAYRIFPKFWGRGLASEAVEAICAYAFKELKLKELISIIDPANTRSLRLAERAGMHFLKKTQYHHIDVLIYARSHS